MVKLKVLIFATALSLTMPQNRCWSSDVANASSNRSDEASKDAEERRLFSEQGLLRSSRDLTVRMAGRFKRLKEGDSTALTAGKDSYDLAKDAVNGWCDAIEMGVASDHSYDQRKLCDAATMRLKQFNEMVERANARERIGIQQAAYHPGDHDPPLDLGELLGGPVKEAMNGINESIMTARKLFIQVYKSTKVGQLRLPDWETIEPELEPHPLALSMRAAKPSAVSTAKMDVLRSAADYYHVKGDKEKEAKYREGVEIVTPTPFPTLTPAAK